MVEEYMTGIIDAITDKVHDGNTGRSKVNLKSFADFTQAKKVKSKGWEPW